MAAIGQWVGQLKRGLRRLLVPHNLGHLFVWRQMLRPRALLRGRRRPAAPPNVIPVTSLPHGAYTEIFPEEAVVNRRPLGLPAWAWRQYGYKRRDRIGPYGVARLSDARLHGDGDAEEFRVETAGGAFLGDLLRETDDPLEGSWRHGEPGRGTPSRRLAGTTVVLAQVWADNYYHFRLQCLPRVLLARRVIEMDAVAHWVVPPLRSGFQRRLLAAAGVPTDRLVEPKAGEVLLADDLIVPSIPGEDRYVAEWAWRYSASVIAPDDTFPAHEKVYVRRGHDRVRRLVNEAQVIPFLEARGFVCLAMDTLSLEQQAALFGSARVIVGVHGAAFTNLIYARPGTRLVEIMPANYVDPCFERLATSLGLDHRVVVGREPHQPARWYRRVYRADTQVSLRDLEKML